MVCGLELGLALGLALGLGGSGWGFGVRVRVRVREGLWGCTWAGGRHSLVEPRRTSRVEAGRVPVVCRDPAELHV